MTTTAEPTTAEPTTAARAAALFLSDLSATGHANDAEVEAAIQRTMLRHGGPDGCAADLAAAYGDHPELAVPRMRWARGVVEQLRRVPSKHHLTMAA